MKKSILFLVCLITICCFGLDRELYESFEHPEFYSNVSAKQFRQIYEEQIKEMYLIDGNNQWIEVSNWIPSNGKYKIASSRTRQDMPTRYQIEVHGRKDEKTVRAFIRTGKSERRTDAFIVFPEDIPLPSVAEKGLYYLLFKETDYIRQELVDSYGNVRNERYKDVPVYEVVPKEIAEAYRQPTLQDAMKAFKEGKTFFVKIKQKAKKCTMCEGTGVVRKEQNEREARKSMGTQRLTVKCDSCLGKKVVFQEKFCKIIHPSQVND